jgi:hypothetical protein
VRNIRILHLPFFLFLYCSRLSFAQWILTLTGLSTLSGRCTTNLSGCDAADRVRQYLPVRSIKASRLQKRLPYCRTAVSKNSLLQGTTIFLRHLFPSLYSVLPLLYQNSVRRRQIRTAFGITVESGLAAGDRLITEGCNKVSEGMKVASQAFNDAAVYSFSSV